MAQGPWCRNIGDRFIPTRAGNNWQIKFAMSTENSGGYRDGLVYPCLLKNELLGASIEDVKCQYDERRTLVPLRESNLFQYSLPNRRGSNTSSLACYSLSPVSAVSQKLLTSARKETKKISPKPFKVLDAPGLQDDFYLSLMDWSSQNILSVGLEGCVYLWSAFTSQVTMSFDLSSDGNYVTSVAWNKQGNHLAVGTTYGGVQVWDIVVNKQIKMMQGHGGRVGTLAWNENVLSSGSQDTLILQRDMRTPSLVAERRLVGHQQEVCGLKWSPDNKYLASGGNDNCLYIWDLCCLSPVQKYTKHLAAVKAIAWSPHHRGILASGGGTHDGCIRFWNTLTRQPVECVDTGSQVTNLAWSEFSSELVSTHGHPKNNIHVWKYPRLTQLANLTGHSSRVLHLAVSPDGEAIATGGADENVRIWNVFSRPCSEKEHRSVLSLYSGIR
ncbi:Fizzy-related protein [Cryptotermes secundus]|uniref:Fizzy-related protein n=1 Tax=Cryptotermes secundus TaxID=105785 RepID=A0A2J7R4G4_9NEOP|nr:fizzy-related protein homolog [Cryptotermes secundus]XP_023705563.1 fizzy-related protein homolog [Cryptotermes secundus]XP_023705564.1 fizzy-related protein homolog [Cryptotermes secundus]PNF35729.1 Fizzy-related protein [Cryptotermes secundus]